MNIAKLLRTAIRIAKPIVKAAPSIVAAVSAVKAAARDEKRKRP